MSDAARDFAVEVVRRLSTAGHIAYWAGGCVRDLLRGQTPSDYDVATTATPEEVRALFGFKQTVAVGASFGVIVVVGPRLGEEHKPLQVEVATFRREGEYSDGRRPDRVEYCTPREDARRRDFTINAMFYDPLTEQVHDFVGGTGDLSAGIIRAVGEPARRMEEDKLRLLRAVRFSARFGFALEEKTELAVREMAHQILVVSWERIADEFRKMLKHDSRSRAIELSAKVGLLAQVLPELSKTIATPEAWASVLNQLLAVQVSSVELSLAILLEPLFDGNEQRLIRHLRQVCRRMKLSNDESDRIIWLVEHRTCLTHASGLPLHRLKTFLIHPDAELLMEWTRVREQLGTGRPSSFGYCRDYLATTPAERLNPEPLLNGGDLIRLGLTPGKDFSLILADLRRRQLDEEILTRDQALEYALHLVPGASLGGTETQSP